MMLVDGTKGFVSNLLKPIPLVIAINSTAIKSISTRGLNRNGFLKFRLKAMMLLMATALVMLAPSFQGETEGFSAHRGYNKLSDYSTQISDLQHNKLIINDKMYSSFFSSSSSLSSSLPINYPPASEINSLTLSQLTMGANYSNSSSPYSLIQPQLSSISTLPIQEKGGFNIANIAQNQYLVIMKDDQKREPSDPKISSNALPLPTAYGDDDDELDIIENSSSSLNQFVSSSSFSSTSSSSLSPITVREQVLKITEQVKEKLGDRAEFKVTQVFENAIDGFTIRVADRAGHENIVSALKQDPRVAFVEQDQTVYAFRHLLHKHPLQTQQPPSSSKPSQILPNGVNRVDGDLSSTVAGNNKGTVNTDIVILDSGIDLKHPDLNVYRQKTFVTGTASANDDHGHGTHVAGIAAAKDNDAGVVGVAPGARLWAVKVLDKYGSGLLSDVIAGIDYITANAKEIDVVNISFGCECKSPALDSSINNSISKGITYVVAAGNSGMNAQSFSPANNPNVITISAVVDTDGRCGGKGPSTIHGNDDSFAAFSNYGGAVDISAPGVNIHSTFKGASYTTMSGTSMAVPHVTGAAALYNALNPSASPSQVLGALWKFGSDTSTSCNGKGRGYFTNDPDNSHEPLLYVKRL